MEFTLPISVLRINPTDEIFSHVVSWWRQVYIKAKLNAVILPSFPLQYKNRTCRIFITYDEFTCFKCQKRGHKAEDCLATFSLEDENEWLTFDTPTDLDKTAFPLLPPPNSLHTATQEILSSEQTPLLATQITSPVENGSPLQTPKSSNNAPLKLPTENSKRRHSNISTTSSNPNLITNPKKIKDDMINLPAPLNLDTSQLTDSEEEIENNTLSPSSQLSLKQTFEPTKKYYIEHQDQYTLNFQNLLMFVDMCKGKQNLEDIIKDFKV